MRSAIPIAGRARGRDRPQRDRREADGHAAAAARRDGDDLPLEDAGSRRGRRAQADILVAAIGRPGSSRATSSSPARRSSTSARRRSAIAPLVERLFGAGLAAARRLRAPRLGGGGRRAPGGRRRRRRADAGAGRRRAAHHRHAAQEHGRRGDSARRPAPDVHAARRADRRHRDGEVATASRRSPRSACRPSTPTRWRATRSRRARPGCARGRRALRTGMLAADGTLDRARPRPHRLRRHARARRRSKRSCIPRSTARIREWFANLPAGTRLAMADIPLLFETGHEHDFDVVDRRRVRAAGAAPAPDGARRPVGSRGARPPRRAVADRGESRAARSSSGPIGRGRRRPAEARRRGQRRMRISCAG